LALIDARRRLDTSLNITSFGESEGGELYVVAQNGDIRQLIELTRYPGSGSR
jgi:hypothetical protein